jgi:hypothetical protein
VPPPLENYSRDALAAYLGEYETEDGRFEIVRDNDNIVLSVTGQSLLDAVVSDARHVEAFEGRNRQAKAAVEGVFAGDPGPLREIFSDTGESLDTKTARWERNITALADNRGAFERCEILGTRVLTERGTNLVTWIRLVFERGARVCRFHWADDGAVGLGGDTWPAPFYGPLRFRGENRAIAFHFATGARADVAFETDSGGQVVGLALTAGAGKTFRGRKR